MTRKFLFAMLYAATTLGANPVLAEPLNLSEIAALRTGEMKKLVIHSEPVEISAKSFLNENGDKTSLDAYKGKLVLLNIWATWCPPCLAEMPSIDALQAELGGDDFQVVTVAMGRNPVASIKKFFANNNIENLPILRDPKQKFARSISVIGLPTTIIINPEGQEIGRLIGDADWHGDAAITVIKAMLPKAETES